ncbi:MAG: lysophospholipid acyltransferase family protein [Endomicrobiales bacterium]|nr:lysophospholipid acyltransferase family protein [Endomicrobiales bacterium]
MKKIKHIFEYILLQIFGAFIRLFPLSFVRHAASALADFIYVFIPIRKKIVIDNLTQSFKGTKTKGEINDIARKVYRQFAKTFFEIILFPKFRKSEILEMVDFENRHLLDNAVKKGGGAVLVGSHFCNWELMGIALSNFYPITFVVGEQSNKLTDNLLNSYRTSKGIKTIPLKFALRGVMRTLKNNEFVAIISDQDAHEDGVFVEFFGRPASTPKAPAAFALRAGCPIFTGHIIRKNSRFHVIFDEVPKPEPSGSEEKDIENYTSAYTKIIESYCRKYPDHWFWMHRRWKTKKLLRV